MDALNHCLAQAGYDPVDEALTRHWVGFGAAKLIEQALAHYGRPEPAAAERDGMLQTFLDRYGNRLAVRSSVYAGVEPALETLGGRGARLAVVTNKHSRLAEPLLAEIGLADHFGAVVCGDTLTTPKPAPEPALHACRLLGVAVTDTLFVGDSATDVDCARAAGCDVVCVRDGYNHGTPADELGADRVIDSMLELV